MFNSSAAKEVPSDPFLSEDPFKSDTFKGLYFFFFYCTPLWEPPDESITAFKKCIYD